MDTPKRSSNSISDENDCQSNQEMSVSKKTTTPQNKHYMSPTVSTASKANPPRRKILAERNENLDSSKMEDEKIGVGEEGFSESPYDPITNYLSPRPRFLRYKPSRRLEILSRVDNCVKEDEGSGSSGEDESRWSQEDDMKEEFEEEFEEVEEKSCGLKSLVKFVLCLIVLVLSTSYISSMNSPTPSPIVQAVTGCKEGYYIIQDHVYGFLKNLDGGKYFLAQREGIEVVPSDDVGIPELVTEIVGKNSHELSEVVDLKSEEIYVVDIIQSGGYLALDELGERGEEIEGLEMLEDEENVEVNMSELETSVLYQELEISEVTEEEVEALTTIPHSENTTSSAPDDNFETENEVVSELSKEENVDNEMLSNDSVTNELEASSKGMINDSIATMSLIIIGGFLLSVSAALYFQKKRSSRHGISQAVEPNLKQVQENNCILVLANEVDANLKCPESSDSSKSFLDSMERDFNEVYQSRAPSVQLLGEFSVQEMSTSHMSHGVRNRIIESEVSSHSVSVENVNNTKVHSSPLHVHPVFSEISSMESPYQKKIVNSEDYAEGESRKQVTTTPLRRSSRIRGRSIQSP